VGNKKSGRIVIERDLIESEAFLSLRTRYAAQILLLFLGERQIRKEGRKGKEKIVITNNGKLTFTFVEAEQRYRMPRKRFSAGLKELLQHGFLEITHHGGAYQRDKTQYALSDRWMAYGTKEFQETRWPDDKVQRGFRKTDQSIFSTATLDTHTHGPKRHPKPGLH
jgi:hypothetical protein